MDLPAVAYSSSEQRDPPDLSGSVPDEATASAELSAVFENDLSIQVLIDEDDRIKRASPMFAKLVARSVEELVGTAADDLFDHFRRMETLLNRDEIVARCERILWDRSLRVTDELIFEFDNGSRAYLRFASAPILSPSGTYLGRFVVYVDATQERELDRSRAEFLAVASHELRTPLTPLTLHLQVMERNLQKGQPIDPALVAKAMRQVTRLTALIEDLIDLSRFESGRYDFNFERLEIGELVEEVAADFRAAHPEREIVVEQPGVALLVDGDRGRLEQVLVNLVDNALKYSPLGGRVALGLSALGTEVKVSVTDQGVGVPLDEQGRLFERFFRSRGTRAYHYGGLGMGLFISHEIVERHGGRFEVRSAPGHGATFSFYLPLAAPAEAAEDQKLISVLPSS